MTTRYPVEGTLEFHVDAHAMGLGGDDSWSPRVHPQYLIQDHRSMSKLWRWLTNGMDLRAEEPGAYAYSVLLSPVADGRRPEDMANARATR